MKKVSLLGLFLAATTAQFASAEVAVVEGAVAAVPAAPAGVAPAPGCPKAFQGFHLGGNIGYGVGVGTHHLNPNRDGFDPLRHKSGVNGVDGGIGVGYTHRLCNWALGIAFDANWTNVKSSHRFGEDPRISAKTRLRNSLQLYGRLGYVLRDIAMPFVALGWDNSQWKHSVSVDGVRAGSKSKRSNGFMWKLGVDFLATKHVVVGFEYTGVTAEKIKFSGRSDGTFPDGRGRHSAQYNKFALTAKIVY